MTPLSEQEHQRLARQIEASPGAFREAQRISAEITAAGRPVGTASLDAPRPHFRCTSHALTRVHR